MKVKYFHFMFVTMLINGCVFQYVGGNDGVCIDSNKLPDTKSKAVNGDMDAIHKLINQSFYCEFATDVDDQTYWLEIASKYGDLDSQVTLAYRFMGSDDKYKATEESCYEGIALIKDAAQKGNKQAETKLSKLPDCKSFIP